MQMRHAMSDTLRPARRWLTAAAAVLTLLVSLAGRAGAVSAPEVFSGFADFIMMNGSAGASASLVIPIGTYVITAKVYATNDNGVVNTVECQLDGGPFGIIPDFDISAATLTAEVRNHTLALTMVAIVNQSLPIRLSCNNSNNNAVTFLQFMKITATRVADPAHLHNGELSVAGNEF